MALAQLRQRRVAADLKAFMEMDARCAETLDATGDDLLLQLEAGDAIDEQAAGAIMPVIDMHLIAMAPQIFGRRQSRRPRTDDADRLVRAVADGDDRLDPTFLPGGVGDELLDRADGDRAMARKFDHAIALAESILRADAAADLGHGRGRGGEIIGLAQPTLGGKAQPVRDVVVQRAVRRAIGHAALRAAARLLLGLLQQIGARDLGKVFGPNLGRALLGIGLSHPDEFLHRVMSHRVPSC